MTPLNLKAGARIDRYRLERMLGEGSFAEVWLAIEEGRRGFSKRVALKILRPDAAKDPEILELLTQEARLCGMLHHPALVGVFGVATADGYTFVVMEYVDGLTLNQLDAKLREVGLELPTSVILDVGIGVCEGLDHAHTAVDHDGRPLNLVHRDMKPGNVMVTRLGAVKITDFGLAKASTSTIETQDGMLRGTPLYVAPEIWNGSRDFRPAMDLFALGAILWELGVGQKMLAAPDLVGIIGMAINGSAEGDLQRLRLARPALGPALVGLLEREPDQRPATAWEARAAMVDARERLGAPGGLDLFMALAAPVIGGDGISDKRLREVPPTDDRRWLSLLDVAVEAGVSVSSITAPVPVIRDVEVPTGEHQPTRLVPVPPRGTASKASPRPRISASGWIALLGLGVGLLLLVGAALSLRSQGAGDPPQEEETGAPIALGTAPQPEIERPPDESAPPPPVEPDSPPAAATPSPTPWPAPDPDPTAQPGVEPVARVEPTPTPVADAPRPDPTPVVDPPQPAPTPPADGCLLLVSAPPGGRIWLDGEPLGELASTTGVEVRRGPGPVAIAMGITDAPTARVEAEVRAGERGTVRCDLLGGRCRFVAGGACP